MGQRSRLTSSYSWRVRIGLALFAAALVAVGCSNMHHSGLAYTSAIACLRRTDGVLASPPGEAHVAIFDFTAAQLPVPDYFLVVERSGASSAEAAMKERFVENLLRNFPASDVKRVGALRYALYGPVVDQTAARGLPNTEIVSAGRKLFRHVGAVAKECVGG